MAVECALALASARNRRRQVPYLYRAVVPSACQTQRCLTVVAAAAVVVVVVVVGVVCAFCCLRRDHDVDQVLSAWRIVKIELISTDFCI